MFKNYVVIIVLFLSITSYAQDTQLSQYYNAPLNLNPALTGGGLDTRAGLNYRLQWPGLGDPYKSISAWADHDFYKIRSGVGFMINRNVQGASKLRSTDINALYSYQVNVSRQWTVKAGLQAAVGIRDFGYNNAVFGDQLTNNGNTESPSSDPLSTNVKSYVYPDISTGVVAYNNNLWLGVSAYHLNRPNQSFTTGGNSPLSVKYNIIGGYKIILQERQIAWGAPIRETSITPTFLYKAQGKAEQLDVGLYLTNYPFMAGVWYRGIPIRKYGAGVSNSESIVLMAGLMHNGLTIGYSYDILVSQLSGLGGGAHELSLIYQWQTDKTNRKGKKGHRPMPCPNVDRQFKHINF